MAHLTNGTVSYERRVKTGDFEHKHAAVTVHYALDEGDDADELLARARTLVVRHVHQAVGVKVSTEAGPAPVVSNSAPVEPVSINLLPDPAPVVDNGVVVPAEVNQGFIIPESFTKPDAELLPRTTLAEALATEIIPPVTSLKAAKRRVAKKVTEAVIEDVVPPTTPAPSSGPSELASAAIVEDDFTAEAPAVTDAELQKVLSSTAQKHGGTRVRALLGEFVQKGQSYTTVPAVRRGELVAKLEAFV